MVMELNPQYDNKKSFYGKAKVKTEGNTQTLISYNTEVAKYNTDTKEIEVFGYFSQTTARHINEFLYQLGFETLSKKQMEQKIKIKKHDKSN